MRYQHEILKLFHDVSENMYSRLADLFSKLFVYWKKFVYFVLVIHQGTCFFVKKFGKFDDRLGWVETFFITFDSNICYCILD